MEEKTVYKRLLYSYLPLLAITVTIVIAFAVTMTYEYLVKETDKSNYRYTSSVMDTMQNSLKNMELTLVNEMVHNSAINDFFNSGSYELSSYDAKLINYKASSEISQIAKNNPLIYSIYLYRDQDQTVLTGGYVEKLDHFPDSQFVRDMEKNPQSLHWSPVRSYTEFPIIAPPERVISLSKNSVGNQGIIVLNVKVDLLLSIVNTLKDNPKTFMSINDIQNSTPVYSTNAGLLQTQTITRMASDYIGWSFTSGIVNKHLFSQAVLLSRTQIIAGIIAVLLIIAFIVYITRKNVEPMEKVMRSISAENLSVRRKQFFLDLQEDEKTIPVQEWQSYMSHFGLLNENHHLFIAIVEIDKYAHLLHRDKQWLLAAKKKLNDAGEQWTDPKGKVVCTDWISGNRMALLIHVFPEEHTDSQVNGAIMDKLRMWAEKELCFAVTIGVGSTAVLMPDIKTSYREASAVLQYKMTVGSNRILLFEQIKDGGSKVNSLYYKWVEELIHHFRVAAPEWEHRYDRIFDQLEGIVLKNEDMQQLLNHLIHRFARDMEDMSSEIRAYWNHSTLPGLTGTASKEAESIKEIRSLYLSLFKQLYEQHVMILESKSQSKLVYEMRKYIEDNYANPDLSLNHISDRFGINGKYASQLFKEEFDIKFVDFLIGLRMEHAKKMLLETEKPISEISLNVGYVHSISFGRVFKKISGVSPGDYRKQMIMQ